MTARGTVHHADLLACVGHHASTRPDAVALEHDGRCVLTYGELAGAVGGLAMRLGALGIGSEDRVALHLPRGPAWVVAALATWRAGAAIVPVDPSLPALRRAAVVERAAPAVVLGMPWADLPALAVEGPGAPLRDAPLDPERLAWLLFSSGSTGVPKGVLVTHRGYGAVLRDQVEALALQPDDRCAWLLSPQFDASLSDIGVALWAGACLCTDARALLSDLPALRRMLADARISYADLPPRLLDALDPATLPALRTVLCGGEPLPVRGAVRWARARRLVGVYGLTEATICSSLWRVDPHDAAEAWIGAPIAGAVLRVEGEELWIGGPGVARGYLDDRVGTAARFVTEPDGQRWHRTGDRVRRTPDGRLVFVGRLDRQTKIDGRLVCPEEIERSLCALPEVAAAVVQLDVHDGVNVLHAHVEPASNAVVDPSRCAAALAERVPAWMVPRRWTVAGLPRTPSGKVDLEARSGDPFAALVMRVLGTGGLDALDSLRAVELSAALSIAGFALSPEQIRGAGDLQGLRAAVDARQVPAAATWALIAAGRARAAALPRRAPPQPRHGPVLLTGATGGLGARVCSELLGRGIDTLALVRASDPASGRARVAEAFSRYGLSQRLVQGDGLTVVCGDLATLHADAAGALGERLARPWCGVLHLAASLDLSADANSLWPVNVDATAGLLALSLLRGGVPMLVASTLSVFVDTDLPRGDFTEEDPAPSGVQVYGGYAQSKLAAEALVEAAKELPRLVVRYGLLTGDAHTGRAAPNDWFSMVVRGLHRLGVVPHTASASTLAFDLTPADEAARATVDLWQCLVRGPTPLRAHIAAPAACTLDALVSAMQAEGSPLQRVSEPVFRARVAQAVHEASGADEAAAVLALGRTFDAGLARGVSALDLFQATHARFGGATTTALLGRPAVTAATSHRLRHLVRAAMESA